jgi:hypothetical protein
MTKLQKRYILQELRQLRKIESNLRTKFRTLNTAHTEARLAFLASLNEWQMGALLLDNMLDSPLF